MNLRMRLRRRDAEAFAELWARQQRGLWSIARAALGAEAAEEALRRTIEEAWAQCEEAGPDAEAWLTGVLGRVLLEGESEWSTRSARAETGEPGRRFEEFEALEPAERILLLLHHLGGLDAEALAGLARRTPSAVRRALHRGRCALVASAQEPGRRQGKGSPDHRQSRPNTQGGTHASNHRSRRRNSHGHGRAGERPLRYR
ncbi:MAG: hypothetical protein QM765_23450 [Myxococcales bacterium]